MEAEKDGEATGRDQGLDIPLARRESAVYLRGGGEGVERHKA